VLPDPGGQERLAAREPLADLSETALLPRAGQVVFKAVGRHGLCGLAGHLATGRFELVDGQLAEDARLLSL